MCFSHDSRLVRHAMQRQGRQTLEVVHEGIICAAFISTVASTASTESLPCLIADHTDSANPSSSDPGLTVSRRRSASRPEHPFGTINQSGDTGAGAGLGSRWRGIWGGEQFEIKVMDSGKQERC